MTTVRIAANQFWCENCMRFFSSKYNLIRHQATTKNACRFNVSTITPRKIVDSFTGKLRFRTPDEQRESTRRRKMKRYWDPCSTERLRKLHRERYRAQFRRKVKKSVANLKGRRTNDARTPAVKAKQHHWAAILREVKREWSEDEVQEQARLLAAYHNVGSQRVPRWVKDVYAYMERAHRQSGFWVPEQGIFWEPDSDTENGDDESTDGSDSDGSGYHSNLDRLEDE